MNISFFSLHFDLFSIIIKEVNQIRNNVVCSVARLVFLFCCALSTGRCNAFQRIFLTILAEGKTGVSLNSVQEWPSWNGWLAASDLFDMFTQSIKFYTFHYQYRCLKNVIHQIDSKNRWLLLSAGFRAKFGLVFVLTLENAFS